MTEVEKETVCVVADGAAIGAEMSALYKQSQNNKHIKLYLPESFEWLVLNSGLIDGREVQKILDEPEEYIDSREYFSWERYFTRILIKYTEGTHMKYKKSNLNPTYLHKKNKNAIIKVIKGIDFQKQE